MYATTILTFLTGFCTAFFAIIAVHILFYSKDRNRFHTVIGVIMAIWAVSCLKDIIFLFPGMYNESVLNWVLIIDGWSALTYMVFIQEATLPGWTSFRHLLPYIVPFLTITAVYALWPVHEVVMVYLVYLWFFAWSVIIIGYIRTRRYLKYMRDNYSDIENIDVSWLRPVFFFAIFTQLTWLFISVVKESWADIIYYMSVIIMWIAVLYYTRNFHPITIENDDHVQTPVKDFPFAGELERIIEEERLYLHSDLNIAQLAQAVHSNRTYVSTYFSKIKGVTFYDYINTMRISKASIPMITEHPEYTLEHVALESGFSSISTFRRAFVKFTGKTPSQYNGRKE